VVTTTVPVETLKAQLPEGVEKNCQGMVTLQFDSVVPYDDAWAPTGITEDQYAQLAAKCVADRTKALADGAGPVDVDGMIKNPDAFKGKFFKLYAEIGQYDAATGACAFRGSWDDQTHEYSFDYAGDNACFTGGDGDTACPELNGIDQDDVVRLWVRTDGAYTYETTMGGSITVPSFHVVRGEVVQKKSRRGEIPRRRSALSRRTAAAGAARSRPTQTRKVQSVADPYAGSAYMAASSTSRGSTEMSSTLYRSARAAADG